MSTAEAIFARAKELPAPRQAEVLDFVEFLRTREQAAAEAGEWASFSASQLAHAYGPADAIYDEKP